MKLRARRKQTRRGSGEGKPDSPITTDEAALSRFQAHRAHRQKQIQAQLDDGPGIVIVDEDGQILTRQLSEQDVQDLREGRANINDLFANVVS